MFDVVVVIGPRYKAPTFAKLRGPLLQDEKTDCTSRLEEFRTSWEHTGCTIMSDGWADQKGRTILIFLVSCPKGTMFMKSVDASTHIRDSRLLCELLDIFIQEVGPRNVVQVIMDNVANYVAAGKLLMERYLNLSWTPCAAHCIDMMLEDIGKIPLVMDIVESSRNIFFFIYNHAFVLSLTRRFTNNKELVRPAITRFTTTFISLQSLLNSMWDVKNMFLSQNWRALSISRKREGEGICRLVSYDQSFWAGVEEVCAILKPLVRVLRLVYGDKPAMGYLYETMDRAKKAIPTYYEDKVDEGLDSQRLNEMVYIYYNLRLWVRQPQKTPNVEAISLDNIDTTVAWRVETERSTMDSILDWLDVDLEALATKEVAFVGEGEPEVEED
eukprot:PITA_27256